MPEMTEPGIKAAASVETPKSAHTKPLLTLH
jgi:hypothetical protein